MESIKYLTQKCVIKHPLIDIYREISELESKMEMAQIRLEVANAKLSAAALINPEGMMDCFDEFMSVFRDGMDARHEYEGGLIKFLRMLRCKDIPHLVAVEDSMKIRSYLSSAEAVWKLQEKTVEQITNHMKHRNAVMNTAH
jgi:hypothetical protein